MNFGCACPVCSRRRGGKKSSRRSYSQCTTPVAVADSQPGKSADCQLDGEYADPPSRI